MSSKYKELLLEASREGYTSVVTCLIQTGGSKVYNCTDSDGDTPLHLAAYYGHLPVAETLLVLGRVRVDVPNYHGFYPLHYAAQGGRRELVSLLLERGADPDVQTYTGQTPAFLACTGGHEATLRVLVARGADLSLSRYDGGTLLHAAATYGHAGIIPALLHLGFCYNVQDEDGIAPLHLAATYGHTQVISVLLQAGADPNIPDQDGATALHVAAMRGHPDVVDVLLTSEAEPELVDAAGYTALHRSAEEGHAKCVELLLPGSDINKQVTGLNNNTSLMFACKKGSLRSVELLLEAGADPCIRNKLGAHALKLASVAGHTSCAAIIQRHLSEPVLKYAKHVGQEVTLKCAHACKLKNSATLSLEPGTLVTIRKIYNNGSVKIKVEGFKVLLTVPLSYLAF